MKGEGFSPRFFSAVSAISAVMQVSSHALQSSVCLLGLGTVGRLQVPIEPLEDPSVDVERIGAGMARQAVVAVRVGDELGGLPELAQRVEHHLPFTDEDRQVLLA